jgi:hypothetical protein
MGGITEPTAPRGRRQGMAVSSLVLGILSVICLGPLAAIPAIILGHLADSRSRRTPEHYEGRGLAIAGFTLGYVGLVYPLVLAAMLLPALIQAKSKAQSIMCANNMRQIGLAFEMFSMDHGDRFPFNVTTNAPGMRLPVTGMDLVQSLQALSTNLSNPKLLVCPSDKSKQPATSMANLTVANISYTLMTGPEVDALHPRQILARCPIHGYELYCDGSLQQGRR